ncbi:MAG TPA: pyruvate kinase [Candidatus Omnitrophota bacterium]|nr:pyruvate kinase [Candidatus Omnitrophota bacterium]
MTRETKIIATLGPASNEKKVLLKMAQAGMNVARLNFSHGSHEEHKKRIEILRDINKKKGFSIKILQDLEGYRIRIGRFSNPKVLENKKIVLMAKETEAKEQEIPFDYTGKMTDIPDGANIFIDDGNIHLKVEKHKNNILYARVIQGGVLKQRKGINIPELQLRANILTAKDKRDLMFGITQKVDLVAQSFVRYPQDVLRIRAILQKKLPPCRVIAKIENQLGVQNIDDIINVCDGIMVARGDLGVTFPVYKVPVLQKYIVRRCHKRGKFVITATQMLESMTERNRPTRAEISDVANAILDGTHYVMLSAETAVGKFPVEAIAMMRQVIEYTEKYENTLP